MIYYLTPDERAALLDELKTHTGWPTKRSALVAGAIRKLLSNQERYELAELAKVKEVKP